MTRRRIVLATVIAALAVGATASATSSARTTSATKASGCANGDSRPTSANLSSIRAATLCLLNAERAAQGRGMLAAHRDLARAAGDYAEEIVEQGFFSHVSRSGSTLTARIKQTSYLARAAGWAIAENLAWGNGPLATPEATVSAWMRSAGHRKNILDARFTEAGIGVVIGTPSIGGRRGATYVLDFGTRGSGR